MAFWSDSYRPRGLALPALLACALSMPGLTAPAAALPTKTPVRAKPRLTIDNALAPFAPTLTDQATFSLTPAGHSAASARTRTIEQAFRFTPSGQSDNRKAFTLGVNSRVVTAAVDTSRAAAPADPAALRPTAYNVDLSVGWQGFAVSTGFSHLETSLGAMAPLGRREALDVALSYRGKNWKTSLQASQEQGTSILLTPLSPRYSVELGGALTLSSRLSVTGGFRYRLAPEQPTIFDPDKADRAVYFGTSYAF